MNRSENMAAVRSKDTKPELFVRRTVHALGYRFRLYRKNLIGNPGFSITCTTQGDFCAWLLLAPARL